MGASPMAKLKDSERDMLKLIRRSIEAADPCNGWASVSEMLCGSVIKFGPAELVEFQKLEIGGRVRLTEKGKTVMEWLL